MKKKSSEKGSSDLEGAKESISYLQGHKESMQPVNFEDAHNLIAPGNTFLTHGLDAATSLSSKNATSIQTTMNNKTLRSKVTP